MALVGYARVSTPGQCPDPKLDALRKAGCGTIFEDHAGGTKTTRPSLDKALAWLHEGDTLVVWKLDRLGRSMPHLIETVQSLEGRGVGFRSLTEGIDTNISGGTLVFHIFGALAQFERDLIRERTRAGLSAARARGRKSGRLTVREAAARLGGIGKTTLYSALAVEEGIPIGKPWLQHQGPGQGT